MPLLGSGACDINRLLREQRLHLLNDFARGGIPKAIRVDHLSVIKIDAELAESASYRLHLCVRFPSQSCRHTGSHGLLDGSNRAVVNIDFPHDFTLLSE